MKPRLTMQLNRSRLVEPVVLLVNRKKCVYVGDRSERLHLRSDLTATGTFGEPIQTSQIEAGALGSEHAGNKMNEYQLPRTPQICDKLGKPW